MAKELQSDIISLPFPENVRTRYGLYIGSVENASILLREIIDNSIDELYKSPECRKIYVYNQDYNIVVDDGRGIPIKKSLDDDTKTMAYSSISELHSGSKFDKTGHGLQIGMNGVGSSATSALSNEYILICKVPIETVKDSTDAVKQMYNAIDKDDDIFYYLKTEKGYLKEEKLIHRSDIFKIFYQLDKDDFSHFNIGTIVAFKPDNTIFESVKTKFPSTMPYVKYILDKVFHKSVDIRFNGNPYDNFYSPYQFEFIAKCNSDVVGSKNPEATFLISFEISNDLSTRTHDGSVNGLIVNRGTHEEITEWRFKHVMADTFGEDFGPHILRGVNMTTILLCDEPVFSSQTKERLSAIPGFGNINCENIEVEYRKIIASNKDLFRSHFLRTQDYVNSIRNLSRMEYIKSKVVVAADKRYSNIIVPKGVIQCDCKDRTKAELVICEGKSAGFNLVKARAGEFAHTKAILPLRGIPMNGAASDIDRILNNQELKDLIATIGLGIDLYHNTSKINYGKVIIASDADEDGGAISSSLIGFFITHMKFLIEEGMLYVADTPLYRQGDNYYFHDEFDKIDQRKEFKRFKGLGSCNADELKVMIFGENRRLLRVTLDNVEEAIALVTRTYARYKLMETMGIVKMDNVLTSEEFFESCQK